MLPLNKKSLDLLQNALFEAKEKYGVTHLRTAIYARKSTVDERETSISGQITLCTEFINKYEFLKLTDIFQEDNKSGMFIDTREEFLKMLDKVKKREIDVIVVLRYDRLSRNSVHINQILDVLEKWNCILISGDDIFDRNTASGELSFNIMTCINQFKSRMTACTTKQGEINNAKLGKSTGGQAPYGLKIVNKCFEIDENEAPAIRTIFSMAEKGKSYQQIIKKMNSLGYKTRKGRQFTYSTLNSLLRNEKYIGTFVYNRENGKRKAHRVVIDEFDEVRNETAIPPIITKATFHKVQKLLNERKQGHPHQNSSSEYILTGFITCKDCGSSMSGQSNVGGRSKKRTRLYVCPNHLSRRGKKCGTKSVNAEYLETAVKEILTAKINEYLSTANAETVFGLLKKQKNDEAIIHRNRILRIERQHLCFD